MLRYLKITLCQGKVQGSTASVLPYFALSYPLGLSLGSEKCPTPTNHSVFTNKSLQVSYPQREPSQKSVLGGVGHFAVVHCIGWYWLGNQSGVSENLYALSRKERSFKRLFKTLTYIFL